MKKYKVVMCDLDNTLLDYGKDVSLESLDVIEALSKSGVEFIPATGRYLGVIPKLILEHKNINYIVSSNGSLVSKRESKEILKEFYVEKELLNDIFKEAYNHNARFVLDTNKGIIVSQRMFKYLETARKDFYQHLKQHVTVVDHIMDVLTDDSVLIRKIDLGFSDITDRNYIYNQYKKSSFFNVVSSSDYNIEITSLEASKGTALEFIAEYLNIKPDDILAIGDSDNDISMLACAGLGIAMGNASQSVKDHADAVTLSVEENGFASAMYKYFKVS